MNHNPDNKTLKEQFVCRKCGACCRGDGFVKVTEAEIITMAEYLGETEEQFKSRWLRPSLFEGHWLKDKENKDCIFLENNQCLVHAVKPVQCRSFPFSWNNLDSIKTCPALKELKEERVCRSSMSTYGKVSVRKNPKP